MIEIITKPEPVKCPYCKAIYKFDIEDIEESWITHYRYVRCPICHQKHFIS